MRTYTTKQGDAWDMIARELYGDEKLMHVLLQANPKHLGTFIFSAGVELNIPDNPNSAIVDQPAPWERPEPMRAMPDDVVAILRGTGLLVSRRHGDLTGRDDPGQHGADAIAYKKTSVDAALQGLEAKMVGKEPYKKDFAASTVWVVQHDLGKKKPEYLLTGTDGVEVVGAINWPEADENQFTVRFLMPVAGTAEAWI